jgi:HAD superfamily hydrolase (TIGR01459 family)
MSNTKFLTGISKLAVRYDAFILDLWGVIHDGQHLYPGVAECLENLRDNQKKIVFLSNAPRRIQQVEGVLQRMGITNNLYDKIVTSGEVFYQSLAHPEKSFFKPHGRHYLYIGLEKDRNILSGLHYEEVKHPEAAQFILLSHSYYDNQPMKEIYPLLQSCIKLKLPLLCINPDTEIVRLDGEHVYCAGVIAEEYRMMGGEIFYFGKPHRAVYEECLHDLDTDKKRIVVIGDNLKTDITGASKTGLANVLVTGGVLKKSTGELTAENFEQKLAKIFKQEGATPDYIIGEFNWN